MNETQSRIGLYGVAAAVLAGLGYFVATNHAEADAMTLLSSTDVQLRLAYGMAQESGKGPVLSSREEMITEAIKNLEVVEREQPGMAVTSEFRGFAHMLQGEFVAAADCYARARRCEDVGDEQADVLAFNEARMRAKGGDSEAALRVFEENAVALDARFGQQREIEEAAILRGLGRVEDAMVRLDAIAADDAAEPVAWLQAGLEYEQLGAFAQAEQVLARAAEPVPVSSYHLARLKLRSGEVDTALACLERAVSAVPAEVRRLLRDEADDWKTLADNARFMQLMEAVPATPGR